MARLPSFARHSSEKEILLTAGVDDHVVLCALMCAISPGMACECLPRAMLLGVEHGDDRLCSSLRDHEVGARLACGG
jgi:hypothetical protein